MPKALFMISTEPASPEREDEYHQWYDKIHIPDILALDGFTAATRYKLSDSQMGSPPEGTPTFLTVYEIESDDIAATLAGIGAGIASGKVRMDNPPLGPGSQTMVYEVAAPRVES